MSESSPRSVVERAFRILGSFNSFHRFQTVTEISRRANIPLTTTHRIVAELLASGALERRSSGEYHVGLRLWEVASLAPRSVGLQRVALPFMQDLFETTHYPVHLGIREEKEVVFIERLVPVGALHERPRVGSRYPMHVTAVGLVLLAFAPLEVQASVLSNPLQSYTQFTETDPSRLRQVLAEVRRQGLAVSDRQIGTQYVAVAAPIFGSDNVARAALSLILPHGGRPGLSHGHLVKAAAKGISRFIRAGVYPAPGAI